MATPQTELENLVGTLRTGHNIPALAAALVHDYGTVRAYTATGIRRADKDHAAPSNQIQPIDAFNTGSISKAVTGFLMARLVKSHDISWGYRIRDAFPELQSADCRRKYGVQPGCLDITIEQLMSQSSGLFDQFNEMHTGISRGDPNNAPEVWFQGDPGALQSEWSNRLALRYRRFLYAIQAMQSPPIFNPGQGKGYGGAPMVCAAIVERKTNQSYEELCFNRLFIQAGMHDSRIGRTATSDTPDGVFMHDEFGAPAPIAIQHDFNAHAPAGGVAFSARDMSIFIEQNLHAHTGTMARILTDSELDTAQAQIAGTPSNGVTRCGWGYDGTFGRQLWHTGDNGVAYTAMRIFPDKGYGVAAMANISSKVSEGAIGQILDAVDGWEKNWNRMF